MDLLNEELCYSVEVSVGISIYVSLFLCWPVRVPERECSKNWFGQQLASHKATRNLGNIEFPIQSALTNVHTINQQVSDLNMNTQK